jgi:Protein of unknown function (DUF3551)
MRILPLTILVFGAISAAQPAQAQTYNNPNYPVCLNRYAWGGSHYYDCSYTSLAQCQATASGISATCDINPYYANAYDDAPVPRSKRYHRAY